MITAKDLRKGRIYLRHSELFKVLDYSHSQIGRSGATVRLKVLNLRSGTIVEQTFNSRDNIQDINLEHVEAIYLYNDQSDYYFMLDTSFEQISLSKDFLGNRTLYLVENTPTKISRYDGEPIDIELPTTVDLKVIEAESSYAGDTAQGGTKHVVLSTGLSIKAPLFINVGDTVRIDTTTAEYRSRIND